MSPLSVIVAVCLYLAAAVFVIGTVAQVVRYARTPVPLRIPLTPAPGSVTGAVLRIFGEVVFFVSLYRASRWTWLFGWLFHAALVVILVRHLFYFTEPVWLMSRWAQVASPYSAYVALFGLAGLLGRRIVVDRLRYVSAPSDYLMLILLMSIVISGLWLGRVQGVDVMAVKGFILGLQQFDWRDLPANPVLLLHLGLLCLLLLVFPFSKLLHAPGIFFSPTLNQIDRGVRRRDDD